MFNYINSLNFLTRLSALYSDKIPSRVRLFFAPLIVKFYNTEALEGALYTIEYAIEKNADIGVDLNKLQIILAKELIRRNVIFWK